MRHLPLLVLSLLLLWAPLPFGSVTPWGVAVLVLMVAVLVATVLAAGGGIANRHVGRVVFAVAGLGVLGMLQASATAGKWFGFLVGDLAARLPASLSATATTALSLAPSLSRQAAVGWWTLALVFAAAAWVGRRQSAKAWLLAAAVASAAVQALYGWSQWRTAPGEILGRAVPGPPRLRGTMVNADHLAVLFEIVMAVCLAWGWWAWRRSRREPRLGYRLLWVLPPVACWLGSTAALLGTGSRAALAAVLLGLVAQSALVCSGRWRWLVPATLLVAIAGAVALIMVRGSAPDLGRQLGRPAYEVLSESRFEVWAPALELWRASPWLGTGLGTFEEAFPRVQPAALRGVAWGRAHNDPLELLVTGGLVGIGLLAAAVAGLVHRLWRLYRDGERTADRAAALSALAAMAPVALHEGVDFGLTIPANALLLTVLLGVGIAGATRAEAGAAPAPAPPAPLPVPATPAGDGVS